MHRQGNLPNEARRHHITTISNARYVLTGGLSIAAGAVQMGARVVLIEGGVMGGDCLNFGCVPSKALLAAAKSAQALRHPLPGIAAVDPQIDFAAVKAHVAATIAKIAAGTTNNIIPETADMQGTIRTLSPHRRAMVAAELRRLVPAIAEAHGCTAEVTIEEGFPVTICDTRAAAFGQRVVEETFGEAAWLTMDNPVMGAEDFAYVLEKVPGAMFWLGASAEGSDWRACCGLHSNRMVLDEKVMARGAALHAALAERFLHEGFGT